MAEEIRPTTELEAVNTMLRAIGQSPVSTLAGDVGVDVVTAKATLRDAQRNVQAEGWMFNTEHDYPLPLDLNGHVNVPANALSVDIIRGNYGGIDPVQRGDRIYDRENHTYVFTAPLKAIVIFGLSFTDMPQTARTYITIRAARRFESDSLGSSETYKFNKRDEMEARAWFEGEQSEDKGLHFLADTPGLSGILR